MSLCYIALHVLYTTGDVSKGIIKINNLETFAQYLTLCRAQTLVQDVYSVHLII